MYKDRFLAEGLGIEMDSRYTDVIILSDCAGKCDMPRNLPVFKTQGAHSASSSSCFLLCLQ